MKSKKTSKTAHTPKSSKGLGDFYGTGVRQPLGKMRDGMGMVEVTPKKLKKPPKALA